MAPKATSKTRLLLLSDTHTTPPATPSHPTNPYRHPLPYAHVLLHAGDITKLSRLDEHKLMLDLLKTHPSDLKLLIPGNHEITLDEAHYTARGGYRRHLYHSPYTSASIPSDALGEAYLKAKNLPPGKIEDPAAVKALYHSEDAQKAGIRLLIDEGVYRFNVPSTGATLSVYVSPYTPEFCQFAFAYDRREDRFNDPAKEGYIPDYEPEKESGRVDVVMTHGPPYGVLDRVAGLEGRVSVGCEHLMKAVGRARPQLHVFGHIHEGYGAERYEWASRDASVVQCDEEETRERRGAYVDLSGGGERPLRVGEETLFVNAAVVTVEYEGVNAPWVVDLDLPVE